eukprot:205309_1
MVQRACYFYFLIFVLFIITVCKSTTITFYVSPNGNNNNNGSSANSPFKTLHYTQSKIRETKNNSANTQFTINLLEGTFYLTNGKSLDFTPTDSGYSNQNNIIYQSYPKNNNPTIISGGFPVPSTCFKHVSTYQTIKIYACNLFQYTNSIKKPNFRSLRIGSLRAIPSRYPKLSSNENPYLNGWLIIQSSQFLNHSQFLIGVYSKDLSPALAMKNPYFKQGNVQLFPTRSWINMEIIVQPAQGSNTNLSYFKVTCPTNKCSKTSNSANIEKGNRFYFYNISTDIIPITEQYEWYYDYNNNILYIGIDINSDIMNINVIIPNIEYIISLNNVCYLQFNNLIFMDSDYTSYGYQTGFNHQQDPKIGVPNDGAIQIYNSSNIIIQQCKFLELSGCGMVLSYKSNNILISNNIFNHLGQSGISLIGNNTIQPYNIMIENNSISYIGEILASAGGLYGSSVSNSIFKFNIISY